MEALKADTESMFGGDENNALLAYEEQAEAEEEAAWENE